MNVEIDPDGTRRCVIWKSDSADNSHERTPMLTELEKRRIGGREGATPADGSDRDDGGTRTAIASRTEAELQAKETAWSKLLQEMHDDLEKMRADGTPAPIREHHERAYGALHVALVGLRDPQAARRLEGHERRALPDDDDSRTLLTKCEAIAKSEPDLSSAEAFRRSLRDPEVQRAYFEQSGTQPPPAPARAPDALAKAESRQVANVEQLARHLEQTEHLSPTLAFAKAIREAGVDTRVAA